MEIKKLDSIFLKIGSLSPLQFNYGKVGNVQLYLIFSLLLLLISYSINLNKIHQMWKY